MFCPSCGTTLTSNAKFCTSCGTKIKEQKKTTINNSSTSSNNRLDEFQNKNTGSENPLATIIKLVVPFIMGYWAVVLFGIPGLIILIIFLVITQKK